jgi:transposase-like protein
MRFDGLIGAAKVARRLELKARLVRKWIRAGYIEGLYIEGAQRGTYLVMIREGRINVLNTDRVRIRHLDVM